jgi:hypothetical protein
LVVTTSMIPPSARGFAFSSSDISIAMSTGPCGATVAACRMVWTTLVYFNIAFSSRFLAARGCTGAAGRGASLFVASSLTSLFLASAPQPRATNRLETFVIMRLYWYPRPKRSIYISRLRAVLRSRASESLRWPGNSWYFYTKLFKAVAIK